MRTTELYLIQSNCNESKTVPNISCIMESLRKQKHGKNDYCLLIQCALFLAFYVLLKQTAHGVTLGLCNPVKPSLIPVITVQVFDIIPDLKITKSSAV